MGFIDRKSDPFILEYSFLAVFLCYLVGLALFLIDLALFGYRLQFDVVVLDSPTSNCLNHDFRITEAVLEIIVIFVFYLAVFTWLTTHEWFRTPNLIFQIVSGENQDFGEFYRFVTRSFPNVPDDLALQKVHLTSPRLCCHNFCRGQKSDSKHDSIFLIPFLACTLAQWIVLFSSRFFVFGKISFSHLETLAFAHSFFHWGFGFVSLSLFVLNAFIVYRTRVFYSNLKTGLLEFLTNEKKISPGRAKLFFDRIGFRGLVFLTRIVDLAGFSHFEFALTFMFCDFNLHFIANQEFIEEKRNSFCDLQDSFGGKSGAYESYDALRNDDV